MERNYKYSAEYFERALRIAHRCEKLLVENFHIEAVNQSGENFCSVIYRIALQFRRFPEGAVESGKYILKDVLPAVAELGTDEGVMFKQILPAISIILKKSKANLGEHKISADCLLTERSAGKEIYILEDLGALGYTCLDRYEGLNLEDAKICLRKMAQFHGASMILYQNQPELLAKLSPSNYAQGISDPFAKGILLDGTEFAANLFAGELPEISRKMKAQIPEAYSQRLQNVVDPKKSKFNAIVHGDLWVNNIMFDRANNRAILVDFQDCFWGSPAIDLQFFFYTSLQLEILLTRQDELLKHYFHCLHETLTFCFFMEPVPTFDQLKDEMHRCLFYGYYAVTCELPICCVSAEASAGFNLHTLGDPAAMRSKRLQLFSNNRVRRTVKASLLKFDQQGILEIH
ncbi:uncharacterized protein LOC110178979 [Drosophila serrata]|uniref:uncharacterized protein LOC110178979 n=1 Tax=Drosophila serrata TaxID=7274 RepID=UPI000A1D1328|nr:uncharacterized protein LOC110178979 [Drosophila serrata]